METQCHRTIRETEMKKNDLAIIRQHYRRYRRQRAVKRGYLRMKQWLRWLKYLNPFHYLSRIDRYIIAKFISY